MKVTMLVLASFSIAVLFMISAFQLGRLMFFEFIELVTEAWHTPDNRPN